jgi:hypothetical protein
VVEGLGFNPIGEESGRITLGGLRVRPVLFGRDDMWGPGISGWRERGVHRFGRGGKMGRGPWAGSWHGPERCPAAFLFFFLFDFFYVYLLLFLLNIPKWS